MAGKKHPLTKSHEKLKKVRGRGEDVQHHLAAVCYLRSLETELDAVTREIHKACVALDTSKEYRKFTRHADHAQQRLHQTIKKVTKKLDRK